MTPVQKPTRQILGVIPKQRAERLLTDLANALSAEDIKYVLKTHEAILRPPTPFVIFIEPMLSTPKNQFPDTPLAQAEETMVEENIRQLAAFLRKAWDDPDLRRFEWYLWKAASVGQTGGFLLFDLIEDPPEQVTAVEAAIFYLRQNRKHALHCRNTACKAPYFFLTKKGQKFCSYECSLQSLLESKRKWWNEHQRLRPKGKKK